jgi:ribosomal protein S18 acetylase RimI-like enzyme
VTRDLGSCYVFALSRRPVKGRIITTAKRAQRMVVAYRPVDSARSEMITVRTATTDDIPNVLTLWSTATVEPSATDDVDGVAALLAVDPESLLLAVDADNDRIVGSVIASWDGWRGAMYRLAVLPSHRRRGIATTLVEAGEQRLRAKGARRFHLIVVSDEEPARAFWSAAGYEQQQHRLRFVKTFPAEEGGGG